MITSEIHSSNNLPSVGQYAELLAAVQHVLEEGRRRARQAVEEQKTRTYWEVGRLIDAHVLGKGERADYGQQVVGRLSRDLKTNQTLLYYALQFARSYPELPDARRLTWSHYRALLPLKDEEKRKTLEEEAEHFGWSTRELEKAIRKRKSAGGRIPAKEPESCLRPGNPYVYRVSKQEGPRAGYYLDLGFQVYRKLESGGTRFFHGDLIRVRKKDSADRSVYSYIRGGNLKRHDLFVYRASGIELPSMNRGIFLVDLGFGIKLRKNFTLLLDSGESGSRLALPASELKSFILENPNLTLRTLPGRGGEDYEAIVFKGSERVSLRPA